MSYDIGLLDPVTKETLQLDYIHQMLGGTFAVDGNLAVELNVTYNYGIHYYRVMGDRGIRSIYGMTGGESITVLEDAIIQLGDDVSDDYWEPTEGNAKRVLIQLLKLAKMRPDGVWNGD